MSNVNILLEEYKNGIEIGEGYANRSYNIIYFSFILYGTVIALSVNVQKEYLLQLIYLYLLPISTYIVGLLYMYNSFVLMRQGYYMIRIEMLIKLNFYKENNTECYFQGWNILSKLFGGGYILAYGTALIFFITLPIFDFICGFCARNWKLIGNISNIKILNVILNILPYIMFLIYVLFALIIIKTTFKMYNIMKNNSIAYEINNIIFNAKPKIK